MHENRSFVYDAPMAHDWPWRGQAVWPQSSARKTKVLPSAPQAMAHARNVRGGLAMGIDNEKTLRIRTRCISRAYRRGYVRPVQHRTSIARQS